jgi:hypothetical protein
MIGSVATIVLWLFVINLGIAFGAGLYEGRIVVPRWFSPSGISGYRWNAEAARRDNVGLRFWAYVTTVPLTLLTLASLVAAWWTPESIRSWWLGAVAAAFVDRAMTFAYFIPTMLRLMRSETSEEPKTAAKALQWVNLGYLRLAAALAAWLAALKAFSLLGRYGG